MKPKLLSLMSYGKLCVVLMPNGKTYTRVVRYDRKHGLYVVIATRRYYESDMELANNQN